MSNGIVTRITNTLLLLLLIIYKGYSQDDIAHPVRIMFYNVENLFDIYNDSLSNDDEFTPSGLRRWNSKRYSDKINALSKTILAAGEFSPPAVVGLCEIENRKVLNDLIYGTTLAKFNYDIIHEDSPDPRGIDVCLIYRKDAIRFLSYRYLVPSEVARDEFKTRSVLYFKFIVSGDTLHLFLNHWPSRRGGVLAEEKLRKSIAEMVRSTADSINSDSGKGALIFIAGDFNATPNDPVIMSLTDRFQSGLTLVNLSAHLPANNGTYRYMGNWEIIDQVIVTEAVIKSGKCHQTGALSIFMPDFLLQNDPKYPGKRPFATYLGYRYQGGCSDHLPIVLNLYQK